MHQLQPNGERMKLMRQRYRYMLRIEQSRNTGASRDDMSQRRWAFSLALVLLTFLVSFLPSLVRGAEALVLARARQRISWLPSASKTSLVTYPL